MLTSNRDGRGLPDRDRRPHPAGTSSGRRALPASLSHHAVSRGRFRRVAEPPSVTGPGVNRSMSYGPRSATYEHELQHGPCDDSVEIVRGAPVALSERRQTQREATASAIETTTAHAHLGRRRDAGRSASADDATARGGFERGGWARRSSTTRPRRARLRSTERAGAVLSGRRAATTISCRLLANGSWGANQGNNAISSGVDGAAQVRGHRPRSPARSGRTRPAVSGRRRGRPSADAEGQAREAQLQVATAAATWSAAADDHLVDESPLLTYPVDRRPGARGYSPAASARTQR